MEGVVRNQVRFIFNSAGVIVGYKNPETGVDTPLPVVSFVDGKMRVVFDGVAYSLTPESE